MNATEIQNEMYEYLCETRGTDVADLFILDGLCGLTDFDSVQEHLLTLIPISEFKNEWVLENDDFRSWCVRNCQVEDIHDEWLVLDEDKKYSLSVRRKKKLSKRI